MPKQDTLQSILTETCLAIAPLRSINSPERAVAFFRQLGYDFSAGAFGSALSQLGGLPILMRILLQQLSICCKEQLQRSTLSASCIRRYRLAAALESQTCPNSLVA